MELHFAGLFLVWFVKHFFVCFICRLENQAGHHPWTELIIGYNICKTCLKDVISRTAGQMEQKLFK
jgi:hypothetical protein